VDVAAIRTAIYELVATTGLRGYPQLPENAQPPFFAVLPGDPLVESDRRTSADTSFMTNWVVHVMVARTDDVAAQKTADRYISTGTPESVWDALNADRTLDGTVDGVYLETIGGYGPATIGAGETAVSLLGFQIRLSASVDR
jgi:hypothetical protein